MKNKKTWTLTIDHHPLILTLAPKKWGYCWKCQQKQEIRVISEQEIWIGSTATFEKREFCQNCALENLNELPEYKIEPKEIIKEVRNSLIYEMQ